MLLLKEQKHPGLVKIVLNVMIFQFQVLVQCGPQASAINTGLNCSECTVKPVLSGRLKKTPKIGFQDQLSLNAGQKYCRMLQESILQYFRPSLELPFVLKTFVLSVFEWPFKTGFNGHLNCSYISVLQYS